MKATGNWGTPYIPAYPGIERFKGIQQHSAHDSDPSLYNG